MMKAVIFDLNGVIVNDEKFCQEAWRIYAPKNNLVITEDDFKNHITGSTNKEIFKYLYKRDLPREEFEKRSNDYLDIVINLFKEHLKPADGMVNLLDLLNNRFDLAVASSAYPRYFNYIIDGLNLRKYFKVLLNAFDIEKAKPDPEIYLKAASLLQVQPKDCLVFEDTLLGIRSAKAAGMKVVAIASTFKRDELGQADKIIDSFTGLTFQDLELG